MTDVIEERQPNASTTLYLPSQYTQASLPQQPYDDSDPTHSNPDNNTQEYSEFSPRLSARVWRRIRQLNVAVDQATVEQNIQLWANTFGRPGRVRMQRNLGLIINSSNNAVEASEHPRRQRVPPNDPSHLFRQNVAQVLTLCVVLLYEASEWSARVQADELADIRNLLFIQAFYQCYHHLCQGTRRNERFRTELRAMGRKTSKGRGWTTEVKDVLVQMVYKMDSCRRNDGANVRSARDRLKGKIKKGETLLSITEMLGEGILLPISIPEVIE